MNQPLKKALAERAALEAKIARLERVPPVDGYDLRTVIRMTYNNGTETLFRKVDRRRWYRHDNTTSSVDWAYIQTCAAGPTVAEVEIATGWADILAPEPPETPVDVDILADNRWVLTDTTAGITWERHGNEWVRV